MLIIDMDGDHLRKTRLARGESQAKFYNKIGISSQSGGGYERGVWKVPDSVKILVWLTYKATPEEVIKFCIEKRG